MNSKYAPLESHLRDSGRAEIPMTFSEVEQVIGTRLPPAARKHRALWSNNPSNWVMTKAWLAAGYETANVDMQARTLVFRKAGSPEPGPRDTESGTSTVRRSGSFARIFGTLKDTVTITPGTNLTDPVEDDWNAAR